MGLKRRKTLGSKLPFWKCKSSDRPISFCHLTDYSGFLDSNSVAVHTNAVRESCKLKGLQDQILQISYRLTTCLLFFRKETWFILFPKRTRVPPLNSSWIFESCYIYKTWKRRAQPGSRAESLPKLFFYLYVKYK